MAIKSTEATTAPVTVEETAAPVAAETKRRVPAPNQTVDDLLASFGDAETTGPDLYAAERERLTIEGKDAVKVLAQKIGALAKDSEDVDAIKAALVSLGTVGQRLTKAIKNIPNEKIVLPTEAAETVAENWG